MIILYRELLPGRNKWTLDYRRASKRVTARHVVSPVAFVTRVALCEDEDSQSEFIRTIVNYGHEVTRGS